MIIPLFYLIAITGAELLTALVNPLLGVILHIIIMVSLIIHASLMVKGLNRELYLTLSLVPMIRLLSLSMPLINFPQIYWYAIIAVPLLIAVYMLMKKLGYTRNDVGLNFHKLPYQILIALFGVPLGIAEYYILKPVPLISSFSWQSLILPALILLVCTGFVEELCFRGVIQHAAEDSLKKWGVVYVAGIFAVMHIGYLSILDVLFVLGVGLIFGILVKKTGSISGVTMAHGIANILLYLVVPFFL